MCDCKKQFSSQDAFIVVICNCRTLIRLVTGLMLQFDLVIILFVLLKFTSMCCCCCSSREGICQELFWTRHLLRPLGSRTTVWQLPPTSSRSAESKTFRFASKLIILEHEVTDESLRRGWGSNSFYFDKHFSLEKLPSQSFVHSSLTSILLQSSAVGTLLLDFNQKYSRQIYIKLLTPSSFREMADNDETRRIKASFIWQTCPYNKRF